MIAVLGAGAFGAALAVALARGDKQVTLWARTGAEDIARTRRVPRLPGVALPDDILVTDTLQELAADVVLLAVPAQSLEPLLITYRDDLAGKSLVACCKGINLETGEGPTGVIARCVPDARPAVLSGPSFAAEIGRGLPTALTIAATKGAQALQQALATPSLRLYRSGDPVGVEVGGALKNVIAIACGAAIGEGMGESARAALMTRGFAEMQRLGQAMGARPETLTGLSGLGDLALTCGSDLSRNFRHGQALARQDRLDPAVTVEGVATARAAASVAARLGLELPITQAVVDFCAGQAGIAETIQGLLNRPLRAE
ncbi:Glycerol-3-phosphate dehydrogenase [NAD(P)+] [Candidatus Rhodobacter oscarellae]|uniref:Glycerol-3-phosphate dehydrogenase [NAD(P)+] n=1 Tax=Candidatus Rhodobacter oscarellae TaxID=1675527 RepID=A0A0J9E3Q4_9RHOB|nr:NAD(P)H-dependent glycerol-3-phosphate dehydrogenase [Candidatus Rhodobacter lobularis]KMW57337.1 Glycerol-3-phosphate dehydrogenase [NAD(P)+] [Candidatus Rhodobacter lobularis]